MSRVPLRHNRDFVLLQLGQGFSTLGSTSTYVAYPLLVLGLTPSSPSIRNAPSLSKLDEAVSPATMEA